MRRALALAAAAAAGVGAARGVHALRVWLSTAIDDAFDFPLDAPAAPQPPTGVVA